MKNKLLIKVIGYILIGLSLLITVLLLVNTHLLVPSGYILAIDGFVASRNLMIVFLLFGLSQLGYYLLDKIK